MKTLAAIKSFGGTQGVYRHASAETGTDMTFAIYLPPQADSGPCPLLWYLSGLTCTHANVLDKGGYQRVCAELGLIFVAPDTSPRGPGVPDAEAYDFGQGAGFYVDATEAPWAANFRMYSYLTAELPRLIEDRFAVDMRRQAITGHSMGGHGALTLALKNPDRFRSVSAFAPIVAPSQVPWGERAFRGYLGEDRSAWHAHDAVSLIGYGARVREILVDQGTSDNFLSEQLKPQLLEDACRAAGIPLNLRLQPGYDHSYAFIATFMEDHLRWHAERLI